MTKVGSTANYTLYNMHNIQGRSNKMQSAIASKQRPITDDVPGYIQGLKASKEAEQIDARIGCAEKAKDILTCMRNVANEAMSKFDKAQGYIKQSRESGENKGQKYVAAIADALNMLNEAKYHGGKRLFLGQMVLPNTGAQGVRFPGRLPGVRLLEWLRVPETHSYASANGQFSIPLSDDQKYDLPNVDLSATKLRAAAGNANADNNLSDTTNIDKEQGKLTKMRNELMNALETIANSEQDVDSKIEVLAKQKEYQKGIADANLKIDVVDASQELYNLQMSMRGCGMAMFDQFQLEQRLYAIMEKLSS